MHTSPPTPPPDQDTLIGWGVRFLNTILDSASADRLGKSYWDRARTALETGTSTASFSEAVSRTAAKLEIDGSLLAATSKDIADLAAHLSAPAVFAAWAELMRRDAVYIAALTRVERSKRPKRPTPAATAQEAGF